MDSSRAQWNALSAGSIDLRMRSFNTVMSMFGFKDHEDKTWHEKWNTFVGNGVDCNAIFCSFSCSIRWPWSANHNNKQGITTGKKSQNITANPKTQRHIPNRNGTSQNTTAHRKTQRQIPKHNSDLSWFVWFCYCVVVFTDFVVVFYDLQLCFQSCCVLGFVVVFCDSPLCIWFCCVLPFTLAFFLFCCCFVNCHCALHFRATVV